jgi:hypothetical protein
LLPAATWQGNDNSKCSVMSNTAQTPNIYCIQVQIVTKRKTEHAEMFGLAGRARRCSAKTRCQSGNPVRLRDRK